MLLLRRAVVYGGGDCLRDVAQVTGEEEVQTGDVRIMQLDIEQASQATRKDIPPKKCPWVERSTPSLVLAWRHGSLANCIGSLLYKQILCRISISCLGKLELAPLDPSII